MELFLVFQIIGRKLAKQKLIHKLIAIMLEENINKGWIILNTMRENGKGLEEAKQTCIEKFKIPIDLYNENFQPDIEKWGESRKIGAQLSIDDTQIGLIGWLLRRFR